RARSIGRPPDVENRKKIAFQASLTAAFARFSTPCVVFFTVTALSSCPSLDGQEASGVRPMWKIEKKLPFKQA
ncbi:hypothetical protein AALB64_11960, partial [Lachnospiraceae bacterium 45-P1]